MNLNTTLKLTSTKAKYVKGEKILTAFPGCEARAARKAAILSVVPAHTRQSSGKPAKQNLMHH